jgi:hypothetical protein
MTFQQTLEQVESSDVFKQFKKEHPKAGLCAGFFILDFLSNDSKKALDYMDSGKIFTFDLTDKGVFMKEDKILDIPNTPKLTKIKPETNVEVDELKSIAGTRALDEGIAARFQKIIAVLQNYENRQIWNLTCMMEDLIVLHVLVDSETGDIIKFERKSFMDFIKKSSGKTSAE